MVLSRSLRYGTLRFAPHAFGRDDGGVGGFGELCFLILVRFLAPTESGGAKWGCLEVLRYV